MKSIAIALLLAAIMVVPSRAQTITGTLVDTTSNSRVAAAQVVLLQVGSSLSAITDSTGRFRFRAEPGVFKLHITALGYSELQSGLFELAKDENLSVLVFLTTTPVEIMPVYVIAKSRRPLSSLDEFEKRMKQGGFGYFLDEKKISNMPAMFVTDIIKRVPGARVGRDVVSLRPHCFDAIYLVDGMPVRGISDQSATELVNMIVSVSDIAGIEVYKGEAGVPGALIYALSGVPAGSATCGVIAIWTKR